MSTHALLVFCAALIMAAAVHAMEEPMDFIPPSEPCKPEMKTCEFWLHVKEKLTMVHGKLMVQPSSGKIYHSNVTDFSTAQALDMSDVVTADGYTDSRLVYLVNGTMPGPTLHVYTGQTVIVHLHNHLLGAAISLHFHGVHMKGTPWSDGVGFVTQCPVLPGQRFTHKFKITQPGGTYWYHAHVGSQRTMGIFGAFIIKNKPKPALAEPEPEEHILLLQDWNHDWDSDLAYFKMVYGMYVGSTKMGNSDSLDGGHFSLFHFQAGLINGKGRYYDPSALKIHNGAPLEVFKVRRGKRYRFRIIAAGNLYPFRVSIDQHELTVVATDGYDVDPMPVESLIINPGERYDVMITADQPVQNYMVRAQTLEVDVEHVAEAILNYDGVDPVHEPTTKKRDCTGSKPCKVLNCPFRYYPSGQNTECILLDKLRGRAGDAPNAGSSNFKEFFLNFAFPGKGWTPGSVNGRAYLQPTVSPLTQPDEMNWGCDPEKCGEEKTCSCAYHVDINYGDTVQMVFLNMGQGKGWAHPIHLHGHSFYVVKMGYGRFNKTTGKFLADNLDIDCRGNPDREKSYCNAATWANHTWSGDNIPGINLERPPVKDTVIVPSGAYVVLRFKADNPGIWIMHCHVEIHNLDGMTMLVREAPEKLPKPPKDFPTCRSFKYEEPLNVDVNSKPTKQIFNTPAHMYQKHFRHSG
ncbi:uncharacterized protein LOC135497216 [Lineus longissimus]|uniref:uncharacterized protein LOC135497216 n=1 Tax=Lineus longissimus TaxID=88925 RepID=UPI002B4F390E